MKKTSKFKVASIYATAIYESTSDHKKMLQEVKSFLEILKKDDELSIFLANPIVDFEVKKQVVEKLKFSKILTNSILVVVENNHASNLDVILAEYLKTYYAQNNIVEVEAVSTYALKKPQLDKLEKTLVKKLGKKVVIKNEVDTDILGGLVIKYNSEMLDASILGKLKTIEKLMKGEAL